MSEGKLNSPAAKMADTLLRYIEELIPYTGHKPNCSRYKLFKSRSCSCGFAKVPRLIDWLEENGPFTENTRHNEKGEE